jgi:3-deoxy-D-manno-octulosonate 8-phosphate phosphatase (KDO 8-P phosphatase)
MNTNERSNDIKLLAMDIDGVLTDGGVYISEEGNETRRFDIKDGLGLKKVMAEGIQVIWVSSGVCEAARSRANGLGIDEVHLGVVDKLGLLERICDENGITLDKVAYIGDDLTDVTALKRVGLACAPKDAVESIKRFTHYITEARGGHGAVREVCDLLLSANSDNRKTK